MQSVLLSIRPKYAKQIVSGEKTVEIRKRFPVNIRPPFVVYLLEQEERRMIAPFPFWIGQVDADKLPPWCGVVLLATIITSLVMIIFAIVKEDK